MSVLGRSLFLLASICVPDASAGGDLPPHPWSVTELEHGENKVVLVEDHRIPLVTLRLVVPVGTHSECTRKPIIHWAWYLQFDFQEGDLSERLADLGVEVDLDVSAYSSSLELRFLREDLDEVTTILEEVFHNAPLDGEFDLSKQVRLSWQTRQLSPHFLLHQATARAMYEPGDPRRVGWERPESPYLSARGLAMRRDVLIKQPGRQIVVTGDVTQDEALALADDLMPPAEPRLLGPFRCTEETRAVSLPAVSPPHQKEFVVEFEGTNQVYLGLARPGVLLTSDDFPAFLVADHVLAGHLGSRLDQRLRADAEDSYGVNTYGGGEAYEAHYLVATQTRLDNAEQMEARLLEELRSFQEHGIDEEERQDTLRYLEGRYLAARQTPWAVARIHAERLRFEQPTDLGWRTIQAAKAIALDDLNAFIHKFYDPDKYAIIRVVPAVDQ